MNTYQLKATLQSIMAFMVEFTIFMGVFYTLCLGVFLFGYGLWLLVGWAGG